MNNNFLFDSGYEDALTRVVELRRQRRKLYGDSWKQNNDTELLVHIKNKLGRFERLSNLSDGDKVYESEIDSLIDLINYSLFLLQNHLDRK